MEPRCTIVRRRIANRVAASSVAAVARELGLTTEQVARLAGGLPVRPGTEALARERVLERWEHGAG